eukprot:7378058-Prymnesium_polylepis.1
MRPLEGERLRARHLVHDRALQQTACVRHHHADQVVVTADRRALLLVVRLVDLEDETLRVGRDAVLLQPPHPPYAPWRRRRQERDERPVCVGHGGGTYSQSVSRIVFTDTCSK